MPAPASPTPNHAEFLQQAKLAQDALASLLEVSGLKDAVRDDELASFVINKVIKATVRHFLC
jgi:hypothetical protein